MDGDLITLSTALTYLGPSLSRLHRDYAKQHRIDQSAPIRGRRELVVNAPLHRVWLTLTDVPSWGTTLEPGVRKIRLPDGVTVDGRFTRTNNGARMVARFAVVDADRELSWTGSAFGAKVVHRFEIEPGPHETTRVTVEESMAGPILAVLFSTSKLHAVLEESLATLKAAAEEPSAT